VTIKSFGGLSKDRVNAIIEETSKIDEVALLKDLAGRKEIFSEFCELERTIYSCRAILTEVL
jgi:hypothetical protein